MSDLRLLRHNEDTIMNSHLGMPLSTTHSSLRQRQATGLHDNLIQSIWDILNDHHNGPINYGKQFMKGGIMATYTYMGVMMSSRHLMNQNYSIRKLQRYTRNNYFGIWKIIKGRLIVLFMGGGLLAIGHDLYCQQFKDIDINQHDKSVIINSTYMAVLFGVLVHPRTIVLGALTGAILASTHHHFIYQGAPNTHDRSLGYGCQLDGLSQEQIDYQNQRDAVEALGYQIQKNRLNFIAL